MAEAQQLEVINDGRTERTRWLLDSPEPPGFLQELVSSIRSTILPHGISRSSSSSANKKSPAYEAFSFFEGIFPILEWGRKYKATKFKNDLMAGLTLASLSIPQSIGYANLAKLDPQYGLYTSAVPPFIYAMMGSSRELAIGPVAVVSLLLSALIEKIVDPAVDSVAYTRLVFTATFFAGTIQAIFGLFRLGFLVDFLSHAAIVGFMAGAAIVIGLQQLKGLIGISHFTTKTDIVSVLESVFRSLHPPLSALNFVLGCSFLIFILITRFIGRKNRKFFWLPAIAPLLSVIFSTLIVYLTRADKHGVNTVKHFKGGLNPSSVHQLQLNSAHFGEAARIGLICAVVALTEAIAVGRSFASVRGYRLDGNKEMVAMGCMNIVGSLTSCYVATGSFSRTAVNFFAGCETVVSNMVMAITVLISLQLFTKLLYYTPQAILASIILSALPGLIDINEAYNIWKVDKLDFFVCMGTFLGVLFGNVEIGLLVALCISFLKVLLTSIRPSTEVVGRVPETNSFCDVMQYPMATKISGLLIKRINSPSFCFANANFIRERILKLLSDDENEGNTKESIHVLILDLSNVLSIDTSGIIALEELHKELLSRGTELALASPRWHVISKLKLAKLVEKLGRGRIFLNVEDAIDACYDPKMSTLNNC